jgi:hypothetical protein
MRVYSEVDLLGKKGVWIQEKKRGFFEIIENLLLSFSKTVSLRLQVPTNIYLRTELLCEYIEEKVGVDFEINHFLMALYLDFLQKSISKYNPMKIYRKINQSHGYGDVLEIHANDKVYKYKKRKENTTELFITIDKKDALKGEMLLAEIDELYGQAISLETMLSNLWINFIEEYKRGDNVKAFNEIVRMLKKQKQMH